ncbi:polyprenyl synthetase family protein [Actinomadura sp. NPDC047616]|uniref:polyprenyl synthetase family protein n=1 Tax=Actinomadura sp. NPDC047616 TaxID=3155914 RepID=UPI0033EEECBB
MINHVVRSARSAGREQEPHEWTPEEVDAALRAEFAERWPATLHGLGRVQRYALIPPGKLVRPLLTVWSALAVGGRLDHVLPVAVGSEAAHTASLMHDDIIDGDDIRRSRPAVHIAFGVEPAIIAGNSLLIEILGSLVRVADRGVPLQAVLETMRIAADAGAAACRGAYDELALAGRLDCPVDTYLAMAHGKTAVFTRAACQSGAVLGGAGPEQVDALAAYGEQYGMAFQIRDDMLAYRTGDATSKNGKPADSDLRNRRPTLPLLLAYQRGTGQQRRTLRRALTRRAPSLQQVHQILHDTGALARAHHMADQYWGRALQALNRLPQSRARTELAAMPLPAP